MKKIFILILLILISLSSYAGGPNDLEQLREPAEKVLDLFTSDLMRAVFGIALCGMAVGFILNRDNEAAKKKFLMWGAAIGIIFGSQQILDMFWGAGALI